MAIPANQPTATMFITSIIITRRVTRRGHVSVATIITSTTTMAYTKNTDATGILAKSMTGVAVPTGLMIIVLTTAGTAETSTVTTNDSATMTVTATAVITRDG